MSERSPIGRARLFAALTAALVIFAPALAIRRDWTDAEVACARSVGVDLRADPEPGSSDYVKRLAWLADLVVYGNVTKVRRDVKGGAPAEVRIKVVSAKKGTPPSGRLTVALTSGEPTFAEGEEVLLFLTRSDAGRVYFLVDESKFLIDEGSATLQGWGSGEYNVVRSDYQIREVVDAQATNCR